MRKSKSDFFKQDRETLADKRAHLVKVLKDFEIKFEITKEILTAYKFFCDNPTEFDGATIVKDLPTIKRLDAPAMWHDWKYLHINFWTLQGLKEKIVNDWKYGQLMEFLGISGVTAYKRSILLIISTPLYYILIIFKK